MKDQRNKSSAREGEGVNHRGCGTEVVGSFVEGGRGLSKFLCTCGHTIRDQSDFLSFKGRILKDFDEHAFMGALSRECEALVNAVAGPGGMAATALPGELSAGLIAWLGSPRLLQRTVCRALGDGVRVR